MEETPQRTVSERPPAEAPSERRGWVTRAPLLGAVLLVGALIGAALALLLSVRPPGDESAEAGLARRGGPPGSGARTRHELDGSSDGRTDAGDGQPRADRGAEGTASRRGRRALPRAHDPPPRSRPVDVRSRP